MKRLPLILLVLVLAGVVVEARAQAPAAAAPAASAAVPKPPAVPGNKIAIIDFLRALTESDPGKSAQTKFDKEIAPEQAKMEKLSKDISDLQTKRQNAKTDAEKSVIDKDLQDKSREGQRIQEDAGRKGDDLKDRLLPPIAKMVNTAVDEYAKANGLALVLDPTTDPSNIVYANTAMDITPEIMRAVNAAYAKDPKLADPAPAPPAPAAPPK
jgi:Skp family chaperone for outer membrane proteins